MRVGQKSGSADTRDFSDAALQGDGRRGHGRAAKGDATTRTCPSCSAPQDYIPVDAALPACVNFGPAERATHGQGQHRHLPRRRASLGSGYIPKTHQTNCTANSKGLFAYYRYAEAGFILTCRMPDGSGSGWAGITGIKDLSMIDADAADRGRVRQGAEEPQGRRRSSLAATPSILEPRANARFLSLMTASSMQARGGGAGGGGACGGGGGGGFGGGGKDELALHGDKKPGDKIFSDLFTLKSDVGNPILRQTPILRRQPAGAPVTWVEKGVLQESVAGGPKARARRVNMSLVQEGSNLSIEDMIKQTRRGLLVTFFWYIRGVPTRPAAAQHRHDARRAVPDRERRDRRAGAELPLEHVAARRLQQPHARRQTRADAHGRVVRRRRHRARAAGAHRRVLHDVGVAGGLVRRRQPVNAARVTSWQG